MPDWLKLSSLAHCVVYVHLVDFMCNLFLID